MKDERMDELLEQALVTGAVLADATEAERADIKRLLATAGPLQAAAREAQVEAEASMPVARARFQRYVGANQPAERAATAPRRRQGSFVPRGGLAGWGGLAAGVGVIALAAVLTWQLAFNSTSSAYAQVVEPGNYVQIEGVIEEAEDGELQLASELGDVEVEAGGATVMGAGPAPSLMALKPGDRVLVSGIAGEGRRLAAQTIAVRDRNDEPPPGVRNFRQLRRLQAALEGRVVTYTISSDGSRGAVLIEADDGMRYLVPVDGASAARLLERASTALGQRVTVTDGPTADTFALDVPDETAPVDSPLTHVRGVITNALVEPPPAGGGDPTVVLTVQTLRGPVQVRVPETARSFVGASDLPAGPRLLVRAIGHTVSITGGLDEGTGQVVTDALVLGPKAERPVR